MTSLPRTLTSTPSNPFGMNSDCIPGNCPSLTFFLVNELRSVIVQMCSCRCPSSVTKLLHKKSRLGRVCVCARVCVESKGRILGGADDFYHLSSLMWRLCEFCGVDFFLSVLTEHSLVYLSSNWIRPSGHRRLFIRWHQWSVRFVCARMRVWVLTPLQNDACILSLLFNYHPHWERERGRERGQERKSYWLN